MYEFNVSCHMVHEKKATLDIYSYIIIIFTHYHFGLDNTRKTKLMPSKRKYNTIFKL